MEVSTIPGKEDADYHRRYPCETLPLCTIQLKYYSNYCIEIHDMAFRERDGEKEGKAKREKMEMKLTHLVTDQGNKLKVLTPDICLGEDAACMHLHRFLEKPGRETGQMGSEKLGGAMWWSSQCLKSTLHAAICSM